MNIDGFTYKVQDAIAIAGQAANEYKHTEITVLHLWKALLSEEDGLLISLYNRLGLKTNELKSYIDKLLNETPAVSVKELLTVSMYPKISINCFKRRRRPKISWEMNIFQSSIWLFLYLNKSIIH